MEPRIYPLILATLIIQACANTPPPPALRTASEYKNLGCSDLTVELSNIEAHIQLLEEKENNEKSSEDTFGLLTALLVGAGAAKGVSHQSNQILVSNNEQYGQFSSAAQNKFNQDRQGMQERKNLLQQINLLKKCE